MKLASVGAVPSASGIDLFFMHLREYIGIDEPYGDGGSVAFWLTKVATRAVKILARGARVFDPLSCFRQQAERTRGTSLAPGSYLGLLCRACATTALIMLR